MLPHTNRCRSYLLDAQQLWVIKNEDDAEDDGPAEEVQREAEQRKPDTPGRMTYGPQAGGASYRLPVTHQHLTQEGDGGDVL